MARPAVAHGDLERQDDAALAGAAKTDVWRSRPSLDRPKGWTVSPRAAAHPRPKHHSAGSATLTRRQGVHHDDHGRP